LAVGRSLERQVAEMCMGVDAAKVGAQHLHQEFPRAFAIARAVTATSNWRFEREVIELPFQPSFVPKWGVAACETDEATDVVEPPQHAVRAFVATANGFLVGYNSGEWGGGLYSYAKSGELLQEILVDNVIRIVRFRDGTWSLLESRTWSPTGERWFS
jgi:hypothetical protein